MGYMGKLFTLCQILIKFRLKPSNDRGEFELKRARSKNNIADNSFALGHGTHNRGRHIYQECVKAQIAVFLYYIRHVNSKSHIT